MAEIKKAIEQIYVWIGEFLKTVLPEELYTFLIDLPDPDFKAEDAE